MRSVNPITVSTGCQGSGVTRPSDFTTQNMTTAPAAHPAWTRLRTVGLVTTVPTVSSCAIPNSTKTIPNRIDSWSTASSGAR